MCVCMHSLGSMLTKVVSLTQISDYGFGGFFPVCPFPSCFSSSFGIVPSKGARERRGLVCKVIGSCYNLRNESSRLYNGILSQAGISYDGFLAFMANIHRLYVAFSATISQETLRIV